MTGGPVSGNLFLEAGLFMIPTSEGGYSWPMFSGYRGHWLFLEPDGAQHGHTGAVYLTSGERLEPGETRMVIIVPLQPSLWQHFKEGDRIGMWDGRTVGIATLTRPLGAHRTGDP
jgi:hypothetical protein